MSFFDLFRFKKSTPRPKTITVGEFVRDGWQANVDNDVCNIFINYQFEEVPDWDDMLKYRCALGDGYHKFDRANAWGSVNLHESEKLRVTYSKSNTKPDAVPEQAPQVVSMHRYTK